LACVPKVLALISSISDKHRSGIFIQSDSSSQQVENTNLIYLQRLVTLLRSCLELLKAQLSLALVMAEELEA
jgi:hypothetical protein